MFNFTSLKSITKKMALLTTAVGIGFSTPTIAGTIIPAEVQPNAFIAVEELEIGSQSFDIDVVFSSVPDLLTTINSVDSSALIPLELTDAIDIASSLVFELNEANDLTLTTEVTEDIFVFSFDEITDNANAIPFNTLAFLVDSDPTPNEELGFIQIAEVGGIEAPFWEIVTEGSSSTVEGFFLVGNEPIVTPVDGLPSNFALVTLNDGEVVPDNSSPVLGFIFAGAMIGFAFKGSFNKNNMF